VLYVEGCRRWTKTVAQDKSGFSGSADVSGRLYPNVHVTAPTASSGEYCASCVGVREIEVEVGRKRADSVGRASAMRSNMCQWPKRPQLRSWAGGYPLPTLPLKPDPSLQTCRQIRFDPLTFCSSHISSSARVFMLASISVNIYWMREALTQSTGKWT
jgi:hypothetical protein